MTFQGKRTRMGDNGRSPCGTHDITEWRAYLAKAILDNIDAVMNEQAAERKGQDDGNREQDE